MRRAGWPVQDESWFPRAVGVATVIVVLLCAVTTDDIGGRIEVLAGGTVTVAGMVARLRFPSLPIPVLLAWTYLPVVVLLARDRNEGLLFALLLGMMFVQTADASPGRRVAAGLAATVTPLGVHLLPHMQLDGWPFWTGGLLLTWYSVEQSLRFQTLVEELERTRDQLAVQAVQLERRRIAADLHDVVGHSLGIMLLHVTGARRRIGDDPAAAREVLGRAEEIGRATLSEMRRVAATLRGPGEKPGDGVDHVPAAPAHTLDDVGTLVARHRATGTRITLEQTGDSSEIEPMTGLAVYRVVQESLVNSAKHAPEASVHVGLWVRHDAVVVEVVDNGRSAHVAGRHGVGIAGMRERVEALGGSFHAGAAASGWTVRAHVPRARSQKERKP